MSQLHSAVALVLYICAPGPVTGHVVSMGAAHPLMTAKAGWAAQGRQSRKQNDKPSGRSVLFRAPCLFQCPCVTHKLNAHFPPLPLFFSCSHFPHIYVLASGRIQLVFLPLKETGRHTWGCGGAGETPTELRSWNSGSSFP